MPSKTTAAESASAAKGTAASGPSMAAAAEGGGTGLVLFDHEAATIWATPMLLQLRRALVLSWRTKLGGNRRMSADEKPKWRRDEEEPGRRQAEGLSGPP